MNETIATATIDGVFLYRRGSGLKLRGYLTPRRGVQGSLGQLRRRPQRVALEDGNKNDPHRVLCHWEGYCENNGLGLQAGKRVSYHTGNALRDVRVLVTPAPDSKTVMVSGFRYKHGGTAKPRRIYKTEVHA